MDKELFIQTLKPMMKDLGFRKKGAYWHRNKNDQVTQSIFVQGSQWSTSDYYVEMGVSFYKADEPFPTQLHWDLQKRCLCGDKQMNLTPEEAINEMNKFFDMLSSAEELRKMIASDAVVKVGTYWYLK